MKFKAIIYLATRKNDKGTVVFLQANNRDHAKQRIKTELAKRYQCRREQIACSNLVAEFVDPKSFKNAGDIGKSGIAIVAD